MSKARELFQKALREGYAIGAFNAANLETIKAVTAAGKKLNSPLLIEASPGEAGYVGIKQLVRLIRTYEEELQIPIILNLDHGNDVSVIKKAVDEGFDYVHYDGSKTPFEDNVKNAREVVEYAHKKGVMVEGEIDHIEGSSADHTKESASKYALKDLFTKPEQAKEFVERTGIDTFASFIGNLHGIYADNKHLDLELLQDIRQAIPQAFLSLHGGSGVFEADVKQAIRTGIVKVNVNSEMRIAFKMSLQQTLNATDEIAVYKIMEKPISEVQKVVETKMQLFGSASKL